MDPSNVNDAINATREKVAEFANGSFKTVDDIVGHGRANVESLFQAANAWQKGLEEISRTLIGYSHSSIESGLNAAKALIGAKTLTDVAEVQNGHAKVAFDTFVAQTSRLSELTVRTTQDAMEPLTRRANAAAETVQRKTAA